MVTPTLNTPSQRLLRLGWRILLAALAGVACLQAPADPAPRDRSRVALVLWRGMTEADIAFRDALVHAPDLAVAVTIYDASLDTGRLEEIVREVKGKRFDLIYAFGTTVAKALARQIKDVPIVYNIVARPIESGVIASWAHSGNNLTGISNQVQVGKGLRALLPMMKLKFERLAYFYNPDEPQAASQLLEIQGLQKDLGFTLVPRPIHHAHEVPTILLDLVGEDIDAVLLPADSLVRSQASVIVSFFRIFEVPILATIPDYVSEFGTLVALGSSYGKLGELAAENALAVLRGKRPTDVPSRTGPDLAYVINKQAVARLGLDLPPELAKRATIEGNL